MMKSLYLRFPVALMLFHSFAGVTTGEKVCYGKYGCFTNNSPFDRGILYNSLPSPPNEIQTKYFLYTRENRNEHLIITDDDVGKLKSSTYKSSRKTVLIIHGWIEDPMEHPWVKDMKDALLEDEDMNVIVVEWKEGAWELFYPKAVANTRLVGAMVAEFLKFLHAQTKNTPHRYHVIGHSLGAQIAGYAGKRFQEITGSKISRLTGLDPARPGFTDEHIDVRLDHTDAEFVDVIHSDSQALGIPDKSGHVDFWPNGGESQRGCIVSRRKRSSLSYQLGIKTVTCSHVRSNFYFIESIKSSNCRFRSYRCNSWNTFTRGNCMKCDDDEKNCPEMGYHAINYKGVQNGNFYLYTNAQSPYCVHRYMYVKFQTGTGWFADGYNPTIRVNGLKGATEEIKLNGHLDGGSTEQFVVPIKSDLGELQTIEVKHDAWYFDPWDVIKVSVQYVGNTQWYSACYNINVYGSFKKRELKIGHVNCQ